jgi:hypothetical protein
MKNFLLFLLCLILCVFHLNAQSLYRVSLDDKIQHSSLIVEGKVVEKNSFWNDQHTLIFTSNKIEVSKIFKGDLQETTIEIVTQGGSVNGTSMVASDLLSLSNNQTGVFFCTPNSVNLKSPKTKKLLYDVYSSAQGFFKYNLKKQTAAAPFVQYDNISNRLYTELVQKTGRQFRNLKPEFSVGQSNQRVSTVLSTAITSFTPATVNAGALLDPATNVLTVNGSGFGTPSGSAAILFDDADDGPGGGYIAVMYNDPLMISWTDNQIKVRVPTEAGTGDFMVQDASGASSTSPSQLNVLYSILTVTFTDGSTWYTKESNLMDANGAGGYTVVYSTNTAGSGVDFNASSAKATFQRALTTWKEISGYNVTEGGTTSFQAIADDNVNVIMYDNANTGTAPLPVGVLAVCYSFNNMCGPDLVNNQLQKTGFDIVVRNAGYSYGTTTFTLGPCPPNSSSASEIDLETVLLHELGHSLNLGHINDGLQGSVLGQVNPGKLMNYAVSNSVRRITPDYSAKAGANYAISPQGNTYGTCGLFSSEMVPLAVISESKDDCPVTFPSASVPQNTTVAFDLVHATSNKYVDPAYTQVTCNGSKASQTNNAYYAFKSSSAGSLLLTVSGYSTTPSSISSCSTPYGFPVTGIRLAVYQANSCPTAGAYPAPVGCATITGDGILPPISSLIANTSYLLMVEGIENTKANFNLTFGGSILPVRFTNFSGQVLESYNQLYWQAEAAAGIDKMVVQKSMDGVSFENIGEIRQLNEIRNGSLRDNQPFSQTFYRLAIINTDRSTNYSEIISLKRSFSNILTAYPNPANDYLTIQVNPTDAGIYKIELYNSMGQLTIQKNIPGAQLTRLGVSKLARGLYQLVLYKNNLKMETHHVLLQ